MESRILIGLILPQPTYLNIGPHNRASLNVTRVLVKLRLQEPSPLARHGSKISTSLAPIVQLYIEKPVLHTIRSHSNSQPLELSLCW